MTVRGTWVPGGSDLSDMLAVRIAVFVEEQGFSIRGEPDAWDDIAWHAIIYVDDKPAATARLYVDASHEYHAGRIAALREMRGMGLGDLLMRMIIEQARKLGAPGVHIGSQLPVVDFYGKYGFVPCGEDYLDEGVPHRPLYLDMNCASLPGCAGCKGGCHK